MSTVEIIIGIVLLVFIIVGWIQGFFKVALSMVAVIAGLIMSFYFTPQISSYLTKNTSLDESMTKGIFQYLNFSEENEQESRSNQITIIKELPFPKEIKKNILTNNNSEMYGAMNVNSIYEYIAKSLALIIINTFVFLSLLLISKIFFSTLGKSFEKMVELPVVRWVDKLGGTLVGAMKGMISIWIFFLIISITSATKWSAYMIEEISESIPLKLLYDHNVLLDIVANLTRVLFRS